MRGARVPIMNCGSGVPSSRGLPPPPSPRDPLPLVSSGTCSSSVLAPPLSQLPTYIFQNLKSLVSHSAWNMTCTVVPPYLLFTPIFHFLFI